ncbi:MAG: carbohydrate-binding family 9-like protein [Bryobacterales bacterium]
MRIALTLLFAAALGAQTLPEYRAGRTLDPIKVDGRLDEFTWAALPRLGQFHNIRGGDVPLTQSAIAWDERNLYAVFVCADRDPWGDMMQRDAHLWDQEVVEVFLDPDADGKNYPELEVSPHNIVVDLLIPPRRHFRPTRRPSGTSRVCKPPWRKARPAGRLRWPSRGRRSKRPA